MATEGRAVNTALAVQPAPEMSHLERRLRERPFLFEFFQAVRLLEKFARNRTTVGKFGNPANEVARFGAHASMAFPASEIQALVPAASGPPRMTVNFMGLFGPEGVLPLYYTQLVIERIRSRDTTLRDFFDVFNHRMISLFYQAWERYRFTVQYEREGRDRFSNYLLDLIGLGTPRLQERQPVPDDSLRYYAGLLAQKPRSATALQQLLEDYFEVPVGVEQFAGAWFPLERKDRCCLLEEERGDSEKLAYGVVVGDEIWDEQSRVRIRLGPLSLEQYLDFLPTGTAFEPLRGLTRFFSDEVDFEVQLVLKRDEAPRCELGAEGDSTPLLGWVTWMKTARLGRDPGDTVLRL